VKTTQLGKYQLLERIGAGGMAEVFKARVVEAEGLERVVAVKRILEYIAEDAEFVETFIDEAKISAQLIHDNITQVYDLCQTEDTWFMALEYVHGKDLRNIWERCRSLGRPMPVPQACFIVMKVCEGLDYAHRWRDSSGQERELVHRDVSPQNILVSYRGEVKLTDFGVATARGRAAGKSQAGLLRGKLGYMSPEQIRGLPLDHRSDIFALGTVLFEVLTGERLFDGANDLCTLEMIRRLEIPSPRSLNPAISAGLERVVLQALARDAEDRYQRALDLQDALESEMRASGEHWSELDLAAWMRSTYARELAEAQEQARPGPPSFR
jgi:serine/threonine protein kinase